MLLFYEIQIIWKTNILSLVIPAAVSNIRVHDEENCRVVTWEKDDIGKCQMSYVVHLSNKTMINDFFVTTEKFRICTHDFDTYLTINAVYNGISGENSYLVYLKNITIYTTKGIQNINFYCYLFSLLDFICLWQYMKHTDDRFSLIWNTIPLLMKKKSCLSFLYTVIYTPI